MAALVQIDRLQGPNIDLSRLQDNINKAFTQVSQAANEASSSASSVTSGIAGGVFATVVIPTGGGVITNPLGKKIQGFIVVNKTAPYDVSLAPNQGTLDPTKQLSVVVTGIGIAITGPVAAGIWFF